MIQHIVSSDAAMSQRERGLSSPFLQFLTEFCRLQNAVHRDITSSHLAHGMVLCWTSHFSGIAAMSEDLALVLCNSVGYFVHMDGCHYSSCKETPVAFCQQ